MANPESHFVPIRTLANRFEADLLLGALEQEGVPALLRNFEETPYDGLFVSQRGWGLIMVEEGLAARAREVIEPLIRDLEARRLYVDPSGIDPDLWEALRRAGPEKVCPNAQVRYDGAQSAYVVPYLDTQLLCFPDREAIEPTSPAPYHRIDFQLHLAVLHYLLEARPAPLSGKWIGEKEIPGGELFFRGPHQFPLYPLIKLFGYRPEVFQATSERLGGMRVDMGDLAYRLWALPRIPLLFVLWKGDDEFEPAMHIRFDTTLQTQIQALDTIWALVNVVCGSVRSLAKEMSGSEGAEG